MSWLGSPRLEAVAEAAATTDAETASLMGAMVGKPSDGGSPQRIVAKASFTIKKIESNQQRAIVIAKRHAILLERGIKAE